MIVHNQQAHPANTLYPLNHLAIIEVTGDDASEFLQGQLTCNIKELSESKASIAAFCNPKGRVISTLLIIATQDRFLLILPCSLLDKVLKKLQMYVLRSKVQLGDKSGDLGLLGLHCPLPMAELNLPTHDFHCCPVSSDCIGVKLPSSTPRFLCVINSGSDISQSFNGVASGEVDEWRYQDISSGLPWFDLEQSEQHIPQMINIDHLGGISFNKGCYTGQEIIARTHYLGKSKRQLRLAQCAGTFSSDANFEIKDAQTEEKIGEILTLQSFGDNTRMLIVLQTVDGETKNLILGDSKQTPVSLIPFE